jgi:exodeoxyribonuclease VII small subunit
MTRRNEKRDTNASANAPTFEAELARLEAIVEALQDDGVELDAALALFEEGVQRLRAMTGRLAGAEARVKQLTETEDGFGLDEFDA